MKKKLILVIVLFFFIGSLLAGVYIMRTNLQDKDNDELMTIVVYPTGTLSETYCFVLRENNILEVSMGEKANDSNESSNNILKVVAQQQRKKLSEQEYSYIVDLLKEIEGNDGSHKKMVVTDSWDVVLYYRDRVFEMNYWYNESPTFKTLVDEMIWLSPIPVDLHSWA